jgi:hypothetical protein
VLTRVRVRRLQPVPGALPERAAQEAELERDQHGGRPADPRTAADDGLRLAGALGGAGARGVVALPGQRAVGCVLARRGREFGETVGHESDRLASRQAPYVGPVVHGAAVSHGAAVHGAVSHGAARAS